MSNREGDQNLAFFPCAPNSIIGENCNIGQNVVIGPEVTIGDECKIQNNVSVYKGVTLEDGVFCGPSMVFTNIYNPRAEISKMDQVRPTLVKKGATIGANATIVCGVTIGKYALSEPGPLSPKMFLLMRWWLEILPGRLVMYVNVAKNYQKICFAECASEKLSFSSEKSIIVKKCKCEKYHTSFLMTPQFSI